MSKAVADKRAADTPSFLVGYVRYESAPFHHGKKRNGTSIFFFREIKKKKKKRQLER